MSGQRHCVRPRCEACGLHPELCVCAMRPVLSLPLSLLVVQHRREKHKPTNSVRPLRHLVPQSELVHYGERGQVFDESCLSQKDRSYCLLFPVADDAEPVEKVQTLAPGQTLVVLDGTWAQCTRMRKKIGALAKMPCFDLQFTQASAWGIRHTLDPSRLSTFEAVTAALRQSGYQEQSEQMLGYFLELAKRMQLMRGSARPSETSLSPQAYERYIQAVNTPRPTRESDVRQS